MGYQTPKSKDYGVHNGDSCLGNQRLIDRQFEEIQQLKQKLQVNRRKSKAGFLLVPPRQVHKFRLKPIDERKIKLKKAAGKLEMAELDDNYCAKVKPMNVD